MTVFRIGDVDFDPDASEIFVDGEVRHLQPQVSSVLACLLRHRGEVVPKDLLVEEAWHGRRTSDESVTRCISLLRRHFSDREERHLIETIPKMGYRFTGPVQEGPTQSRSVQNRQSPHELETNHTKRAVNLLITAVAVFALLSGLVIASDFFTLR